MTEPVSVRVEDVRFYIRNMRTRMPFRYGQASLRFAPLLHVRLTLETDRGDRACGEASDILPPKWFDKSPDKTFEDNVDDLLRAARTAADVYTALTAGRSYSPFRLWREGYKRILRRADECGMNHLTAGHGSSLMERAVIDAVGRSCAVPYADLVLRGYLGFEPAAVHPELAGQDWQAVFAGSELESVFVRHAVGLADPLHTADIASADRLDDGLPQSLEEYIQAYGLRYFKIKLCGDHGTDTGRLRSLARLLDGAVDGGYSISLDGNEQYTSVKALAELFDFLRGEPSLRRFFGSVLYVEQPFPRGLTADAGLHADIRRLTRHLPLVIDEADSDLSSFKDAAALGYQGVSSKNCKGIFKTLLNRLLIENLNRDLEGAEPPYFMTAEDLMNAPAVALHQDLNALTFLGIRHAERNAYHYMRGLDHLTPRERSACLARHPSLYVPFEDGARLDIREGRLDLRSLRVPGMGVGIETDFDALVPLERWRFDSLLAEA